MKVSLLFRGTYPGGMAMSKRLRLYGQALLEAGVEARVLANGPGKGAQAAGKEIPCSYYKDPIVTTLPVLRLLNNWVATGRYFRLAMGFSRTCDVLFICGFGWLAALFILLGAHRTGTRVVMECNENPYAPEGGRLDFVWLRRINRCLMLKLVYPRVDGFIVISEKLESLVHRHGKSPAVLKVPILVGDERPIPRKEGQGEVPFILHTGAMSETKDGMVAMFRAFVRAAAALDGQLRFVLTRKQMHRSLSRQLDKILEEGGVTDQVSYLGFVGEEELQDLRARCATAILNKPSNWQNDYNFSTKLGEYMLAGIPVIASNTGEMSNFLQDGTQALLFPANDETAMAEKILLVLRHPDKARKMGEAGRDQALESFHYLQYAGPMKSFFEGLSHRKRQA